MSVEFGRGDLGIVDTVEIGALVVSKGWLWCIQQVVGIYAGHTEFLGAGGWSHHQQKAYNIWSLHISLWPVFKYSLLTTLKARKKSHQISDPSLSGPTKVRSHLHNSPSYIYAYLLLGNLFYEAASGN
ncbi:hypothetical protein B9Z19DRAFT_1134143 [Tuber borchii]|uniref:Uncharacterized protein n=1 Tax=Tuber borchii TaxID=42251 RepID=A0A2T6ZEL0_TUBBO|nr:hypothetical protein B9Z19DRAFT_1134143 [Tuber borchii]